MTSQVLGVFPTVFGSGVTMADLKIEENTTKKPENYGVKSPVVTSNDISKRILWGIVAAVALFVFLKRGK